MTNLTSELNLLKGEDEDDTADYLTISLASSLDILDGLFNTTTGHNHSGAHQGGNLNFQNLTIAGTLTATGLVVNGASTLNGTANVVGAATFQSTLNVAGVTTLAAVNASSVTTPVLQVNGNGTVTGALSGGTVSSSGRITSGSDLVVTNGNIYLNPSGDTLVQRAAADQLRVPSTVFFGPNVIDTYIQRSGPIGGQPHPLMVVNPGSGLWLLNDALTLYTPTDPQGGGQQLRVIRASTRPAATYGGGEVNIQLRLYVDGDIWSGSHMHAIDYLTTSDMSLKQNVAVLSDDECMTRVRRAQPVYSYEIPPPIEGGEIAPTPTDIGFSADDVYASNPEFAALNGTDPVAVNYSNMSALLWGALRQLDARCQAKGI